MIKRYRTINDWTVERMKARIRERNNGTRAVLHGGGACVYETSDGNHCAVGCFIPDGHLGMTCLTGVHPLLDEHHDLVSVMPLEPDGLHAMQFAHDHAEYGADIREVLCAWLDENVEDGEVSHV